MITESPSAPLPEKLEKVEKSLRKLEESKGVLAPDDRYRALINAVKAAQDHIELGDKKARFALVIMSVLNAIAVLLVTRSGTSLLPSRGVWALAVAAELTAYVVVALYYVAQAVSALRPRGVRPPPAQEIPAGIAPAASMRVLFHADVVARDRAAYRSVWEQLRMDNLTTELADQLYTLSVVNQQKYAALDRLYGGLTVMTVLLGLLLGTVGLANLLA